MTALKSYIESYISILPQEQRERLSGLLNVGPEIFSGTAEETEARIRELMTQLGQYQIVSNYEPQPEQTNSELYNTTLKNIIADLNTLYDESSLLDTLIFNHKLLNESALGGMQNDIDRLKKKIEALNLIADNVQGYSSAVRDNFSDAGAMETDVESNSEMFVDRDGTSLYSSDLATVDEMEGTLKLGSSAHYDRLHNSLGGTIAGIKILRQTGAGYAQKSPNFSIEKAIDNDIGSFWGEVILSDGSLQMPLDTTGPTGASNPVGGAICQFKITFPSPCTVSQFSIRPYCEYPMELISIGYTRDSTDTIAGYCLPPMYGRLIEDGKTEDFPAVMATGLIVTIRQTHATDNFYTITKDSLYNRQLWEQIIAAETKTTLESQWIDLEKPENPVLAQDKIDEFDTLWQEYLSAKREYEKREQDSKIWGFLVFMASFAALPTLAPSLVTTTLERSVASAALGYGTYSFLKPDQIEPPQRIKVHKYEYVYGAYEIDVAGNEYNRVGIYVSKPYPVSSNVVQVVLEANEWHPTFTKADGTVIGKKWFDIDGSIKHIDIPLRRTSVEYYVSPDGAAWYPILPLVQDTVDNEMLFFKESGGSIVASLRFYVDDSKQIRVYRNEEPLEAGYGWWLMSDSLGYNQVALNPVCYSPNASYTIDYYPFTGVRDPYAIDFDIYQTTPKTCNEYFNGPDLNVIDKNGSAKLTYYPYVDRRAIKEPGYAYNPVEVTLNPSDKYTNPNIHKIQGNPFAITGEILSMRNPSPPPGSVSGARLLNVTDYETGEEPSLNPYVPNAAVPTFEYYHSGNRVYFTETFRDDGPVRNIGISHGNAIVKISYQYLVSGIRTKIILRRTNLSDASVTPKVDWYSLKFKTLRG